MQRTPQMATACVRLRSLLSLTPSSFAGGLTHNKCSRMAYSSTAEPTPSELVQQTVDSNRVVVFSDQYCPFCKKIKKLLFEDFKVPDSATTVLEIDNHPLMYEIKTELKKRTGATSVPRLFIDGSFVGGYSETRQLAEEGKLKDLLQPISN